MLKLKGNSKKSVKWKTSSKSKVSILSKSKKQAVLVAKKAGSAKITAKVGKKTLICKVKVKKNKGIPAKLQMAVSTVYSFNTDEPVDWTVSDPSLLSLGFSGTKVKLKALRAGTVVIKATAGSKTWTCTVTILNKNGSKGSLPQPAPSEESSGNMHDGYPVKEITTYESSGYRDYWYGETENGYIHVKAEGNHLSKGDGLRIGVHSNVSGLTVTGGGTVSASWLSAEEAAMLPWTSKYDYILDIDANDIGNGTVTIKGTVNGKEIKCIVPIIVEED